MGGMIHRAGQRDRAKGSGGDFLRLDLTFISRVQDVESGFADSEKKSRE